MTCGRRFGASESWTTTAVPGSSVVPAPLSVSAAAAIDLVNDDDFIEIEVRASDAAGDGRRRTGPAGSGSFLAGHTSHGADVDSEEDRRNRTDPAAQGTRDCARSRGTHQRLSRRPIPRRRLPPPPVAVSRRRLRQRILRRRSRRPNLRHRSSLSRRPSFLRCRSSLWHRPCLPAVTLDSAAGTDCGGGTPTAPEELVAPAEPVAPAESPTAAPDSPLPAVATSRAPV